MIPLTSPVCVAFYPFFFNFLFSFLHADLLIFELKKIIRLSASLEKMTVIVKEVEEMGNG